MSTIYCSFIHPDIQDIVERQQQMLGYECKGKQILDAGSWMLDETPAQTGIYQLLAYSEHERPGGPGSRA